MLIPRLLSLVTLTIALLVTFYVEAESPQSPEPLATWTMDEVGDAGLKDQKGSLVIAAEDVEAVEDRRRGRVIQWRVDHAAPLPAELVKQVADGVGVAMWVQSANVDPTFQHLFTIIHDDANWDRQTHLQLRWGRPLVNLSGGRTVDTNEDLMAMTGRRSLKPGHWYHLFFYRDSQGFRLLLDGKLLSEGKTPDFTMKADEGMFIGGKAWNGRLSQIEIFDHPLSEEQVKSLIAAQRPASSAGADEPAPNIAGMTMGEVDREDDYLVSEIKEFFPPIQKWGELGVKPAPDEMAESFAKERFTDVPAPGVHPRIYFGPDDLPRIREQAKTSRLARVQLELMRGRLLQFSENREDWENIPDNQEEFERVYEDYLSRGIRINRRMGYHGPWVGGWVNDLAQGKDPDDLAGDWHLNTYKTAGRNYMMHLMPWEALRCLLDEDEEGGKRVAAALVTVCDRFAQHMDQYGPEEDNWQGIYQHLSSASIGLTYDWAYEFMTDEQRTKVRQFISDVTRGKSFLGLDQLPAFPGNTTNWIIIHMNLLPMILAIEGEEGYDPLVYDRLVEGMRKWVYVANGPDGAPFEGYMKSYYAPDWLLPLAKRGEPFLGTTWSKNVIRKYALGVMLPWGRDHVFYTGIGTTQGLNTFKYAHPNDPVVDLIYGNLVENDINSTKPPVWPGIRTTYAPKWEQVFIQDDPIGTTDQGYDFDQRLDQVMQQLTDDGEPLTYYSDYRGVFTARSAWDRNATFLFFEPRNIPGGHTWASRNDFVIASHGRLWGNRPDNVEGPSERRSLILIDGEGQGHHTPQGRTLSMADTPDASFCVGDAKWAYSHAAGKDTDEPVMVSPNDSRLEPSPLPWMDQPWSFLPNWVDGTRGAGRHGHWRTHNPVEHAFRSVGLVRGESPYVVLVDDLRKDDQPHQYDWLMQTPDDVKLLSKRRSEGGAMDLILADDEGRRLLIRVLEAGESGDVSEQTFRDTRHEAYEWENRGKTHTFHRVVVPVRSTDARFKMVFFPHREGDALPQTRWGGNADSLVVKIGETEDRFGFEVQGDRRTTVTLSRGDQEVLKTD